MTDGGGSCLSCGAGLRPDDRFCRTCGRPIASPEPVSPPAVAAPVKAPQPAPVTAGWPSIPSTAWATTTPRRGNSPARRLALGCATVLVGLFVIGFVGAFLEGDIGGTGPGAGIGSPTSGATEPLPTGQTAVPGETASSEVTSSPEATPREITLSTAVAQKLVSMTAAGENLQELSLTLTSRADETLTVVVPAGIIFKPAAGGTQPMIVVRAVDIHLPSGGSSTMTLDVACASMHLDQPDDADRFTISTAKTASALLKVLALPDFRDADFRVQQFAIWTITDNPTRSGYVRLGSFGLGSGPDDEEIAQIKSLFREAGVNPANYRALR